MLMGVFLRNKLVHRDGVNVVNVLNVFNVVNVCHAPHPHNLKSVYIGISQSLNLSFLN